MPMHVEMDEEGAVTLPPELIERLGWTPDTLLHLTITPNGDLSIEAADADREGQLSDR